MSHEFSVPKSQNLNNDFSFCSYGGLWRRLGLIERCRVYYRDYLLNHKDESVHTYT